MTALTASVQAWPNPLRPAEAEDQWVLWQRVGGAQLSHTAHVLAGLPELRPAAPVTELTELGHYPHIEQPRRIAALVVELASSHTR